MKNSASEPGLCDHDSVFCVRKCLLCTEVEQLESKPSVKFLKDYVNYGLE